MIETLIFPCLQDNFGLLIHNSAENKTLSIDAPEAPAIEKALQGKGWQLDEILITHHHFDHVAGAPALKEKLGCKITAPKKTKFAIADVELEGDEEFIACGIKFQAIPTPGHTLDHMAYYAPEAKILAAADALFSLGCGRMFEGTAAQFWDSLNRLSQLPDDVMLYCGHEYTQANARFALHADPNNEMLQRRCQEVEQLRKLNKHTLPISLELEKQTNPFLRVSDPAIRAKLDLPVASNEEVFAALRALKDQF